ncbi:MAG: 50S ribosomal protein L10 [Patescibacteria group bacterium]
MAKTRTQKEEQIAKLESQIETMKSAVFVDYKGLKVKETEELRKKLAQENVDFNVTKNTLAKKALSEKGIEITPEIFEKPVAIAFAKDDEVTGPKGVNTFAKDHESLEILGGILEGKFIDATMVKKLALLPSREQLYAKVVGSIASPLSGMVNVLSGNLRGLVNVLNSYKETIS